MFEQIKQLTEVGTHEAILSLIILILIKDVVVPLVQNMRFRKINGNKGWFSNIELYKKILKLEVEIAQIRKDTAKVVEKCPAINSQGGR